MKLRRILITLTLCLLLSPSFANPYQRQLYSTSPQPVQQSPADVLKQGIDQLTQYLGNRGGKNAMPLEVFVEKNIAPFFDFDYMTKWTAGRQARFMNQQQATAMRHKLRRLFLASMVKKLSEYRHGYVKYLRPTSNPRTGELTLKLLAYQQGNPYPQRLSFRMYRSNKGWKVFDVSSNGHSALAFYRTQFSIEARNQRRQNYSQY